MMSSLYVNGYGCGILSEPVHGSARNAVLERGEPFMIIEKRRAGVQGAWALVLSRVGIGWMLFDPRIDTVLVP